MNFFFLMIPPPPISTLFPYTTLFRSSAAQRQHHQAAGLPSAKEISGAGLHVWGAARVNQRSEEHTSELQSRFDLVCRLLLEKKKTIHSHHKHDSSQPTIAL